MYSRYTASGGNADIGRNDPTKMTSQYPPYNYSVQTPNQGVGPPAPASSMPYYQPSTQPAYNPSTTISDGAAQNQGLKPDNQYNTPSNYNYQHSQQHQATPNQYSYGTYNTAKGQATASQTYYPPTTATNPSVPPGIHKSTFNKQPLQMNVQRNDTNTLPSPGFNKGLETNSYSNLSSSGGFHPSSTNNDYTSKQNPQQYWQKQQQQTQVSNNFVDQRRQIAEAKAREIIENLQKGSAGGQQVIPSNSFKSSATSNAASQSSTKQQANVKPAQNYSAQKQQQSSPAPGNKNAPNTYQPHYSNRQGFNAQKSNEYRQQPNQNYDNYSSRQHQEQHGQYRSRNNDMNERNMNYSQHQRSPYNSAVNAPNKFQSNNNYDLNNKQNLPQRNYSSQQHSQTNYSTPEPENFPHEGKGADNLEQMRLRRIRAIEERDRQSIENGERPRQNDARNNFDQRRYHNRQRPDAYSQPNYPRQDFRHDVNRNRDDSDSYYQPRNSNPNPNYPPHYEKRRGPHEQRNRYETNRNRGIYDDHSRKNDFNRDNRDKRGKNRQKRDEVRERDFKRRDSHRHSRHFKTRSRSKSRSYSKEGRVRKTESGFDKEKSSFVREVIPVQEGKDEFGRDLVESEKKESEKVEGEEKVEEKNESEKVKVEVET